MTKAECKLSYMWETHTGLVSVLSSAPCVQPYTNVYVFSRTHCLYLMDLTLQEDIKRLWKGTLVQK
jgi:hypothetical protein